MTRRFEVTAGGEELTFAPHFSQGEGGRQLIVIEEEFKANATGLYQEFEGLGENRKRRRIGAGTICGVLAAATALTVAGWAWSQGEGQATTSNKVHQILEDPNELRVLGICSLELQKQAAYAHDLEAQGKAANTGIKAVEYDTAAQLAATNNIGCNPQIVTGSAARGLTADILQFDVSFACQDAAYYSLHPELPDAAEITRLTRELAAETQQVC